MVFGVKKILMIFSSPAARSLTMKKLLLLVLLLLLLNRNLGGTYFFSVLSCLRFSC